MLVLRALGLGDLLTAVPALRALRRGLRDPVITLATPAALAPLVQLTGVVDELLPATGLGPLPRIEPPDLGVNLHGKGPQSIAALLGTGATQLLSHAHPAYPELTGPDWLDDQHEVTRWCRLPTWAGLPADPTDLRLRPPDQTPVATDVIMIHPGAASPARRWPVDRFAAVAKALSRDGHRVVITGTASERALADELAERACLAAEEVLAGALDLAELAALVAVARLVVCGDTGVAHLASAYGVPSVLLFGPTPPATWGPPPGPHTVLWSGQRGDPHGQQLDPGLQQIEVSQVLAAATARLAEPIATRPTG